MDKVGQSLQICTGCGEAKQVAEFDLRRDTGKRRGTCKPCRRHYQRKRWEGPSDVTRSKRVVRDGWLYPCRICGETKGADAFPRRSRTSQYLQSWCKACFSKYKAERHIKHHDREMRRIKRNQQRKVEENRERIAAYLAAHPCVDCGEADPVVLDFDHLRDKWMDVSRLVHSGWSWETILREIAKCQVRCANDHRRATRKREQERKAALIAV